jgi:hypothetical protein
MFQVMKPTKQAVTRLDYCQYLLSSQINDTLTNFADHTDAFSHDKLNRYLAGDKITPHLVLENVKEQVVQHGNGYIVLEETQRTIYRVKYDLLSDYLRQQLKSPTIKMSLA